MGGVQWDCMPPSGYGLGGQGRVGEAGMATSHVGLAGLAGGWSRTDLRAATAPDCVGGVRSLTHRWKALGELLTASPKGNTSGQAPAIYRPREIHQPCRVSSPLNNNTKDNNKY